MQHLKAILNISRLDQATGKEMITVYQDYLETGDKRLYQVLLLHNEDDLKALPQIMPLLSYLDIFRSVDTCRLFVKRCILLSYYCGGLFC